MQTSTLHVVDVCPLLVSQGTCQCAGASQDAPGNTGPKPKGTSMKPKRFLTISFGKKQGIYPGNWFSKQVTPSPCNQPHCCQPGAGRLTASQQPVWSLMTQKQGLRPRLQGQLEFEVLWCVWCRTPSLEENSHRNTGSQVTMLRSEPAFQALPPHQAWPWKTAATASVVRTLSPGKGVSLLLKALWRFSRLHRINPSFALPSLHGSAQPLLFPWQA